MMRFGRKLDLELYGSSHGPEVGLRLRGIPPGLPVDLQRIQGLLDRRRPGTRRLASRRQEEDRLVIDRGWADGRADGSEFVAHVANTDARRSDYDPLRSTPRPGHADYPARVRFGPEADLSGGGIFSGRMTVGLVVAGAIADEILRPLGIEVVSFTRSIGEVVAEVSEGSSLEEIRAATARNEVGCPDAAAARRMEQEVENARRSGDSVGGVIETRATGVPVGLGEPFFDSIESVLAHLALAVPGVKGIEFGAGFRASSMRGSEHNDPFYIEGDRVRTRTNHAGGILGGLATGMPIVYRVVVKPTSSIAIEQETIDLASRRGATVRVGGRHDPCIVPRAAVVLESVTRFGLADLALAGGFAR
ncbi:MAG TPA: chorismate synthase [Thermoplasmata archaeon]|nr:chorismate synthase [Thermoplasmata archaeon]